MLQLRVRAVNDNGSIGSNSRIIPTKEITYTTELNATATLDFSVSRNDWAPVQEPFLVRVEYSVNGGPFAPVPTNDLFISESNSDDSKDPDKIVSYTLVSYGSWLLAGAYVGTGPWQKDNERRINGDGAYKANAGQIMAYFIDESKSRGWLKYLNRNSFNATKDSNGVNWTTGDKAEIAWRLETFYNTVLEQLSEQMYCDWSTTGNQLHLYRPGTLGTAKPDLVLGGPDYTRVPVKVDSSGWYTHVIGVSEAGRFHASNASAEARFGRRSISMSQTGVKDAATSQRMVNDLLAEGLDSKREEAYEWVPRQNTFYPFRDFRVGDHVTALSRGGTQIRRVISIIVTQGENAASVQVRAGEKIKSINIKNARKLASTSVGGVIGGSGGAFPTSPPLPTTQPMAPDGLSVQSNTSEWLNDGSAKSYVTLTWSPVTEGADGSEVDIVEYEVWTRTPSTTRKRLTATNTNTIDLDNLVPGQETLVSVRAKTDRNVWGPFSLELTLTPQYPSSVVPKPPTGLTATSNVGGWVNGSPVATVQLSWAAVTESVDDEPVEVVEYEVWENDAPKQRVTTPGLKVDIPSGITREYRVRARSAFGVWGDLSAVPATEVVGQTPTLATLVPTKPTLTTGLGLVIATWNGNYTTTPTQAALGVRVEARVAGGSWKQQGAVLTSPGDQAVSVGSTGDTVEVRLVAMDRLNRTTGTSAVESIVMAGIGVGDLGSDVAAVIENAETLADRALLSTNGLNRIIPSYAHPGDGWIGAGRNLFTNPRLVGDGTWAEVRRNLALNPSFGGGSTANWNPPSVATGGSASNALQGVNSGPVSGTRSWKATLTNSPAVNGASSWVLGWSSQIANISTPVSQGQKVTLSMFVRTSRATQVNLLCEEYVRENSSLVRTVHGPATEVPANTWTRVQVVATVGATTNAVRGRADFYNSLTGGVSAIGDTYEISAYLPDYDVDVLRGYFDGSTMDASMPQPEDFRVRWLGAPNASESVMEIERVRGLTGVNCIPGLSSVGGVAAVRQIPTAPSSTDVRMQFGIPSPARGSGTFLATAHLLEPLAGPLHPVSRTLRATLPASESVPFPNAVGEYPIRLTFGALSSLYEARFYHGGAQGSGDVWWTDIGLYAGDPTMEEHLRLHNGDTWWELDESETSIVRTHMWNGQSWVPHQFVADTIIAAGSITAPLIKAGEIKTNHIDPAVGGQLNLSANESIVLIAGRQDEQSSDLAATQEQLDIVDERSTEALTTAEDAAYAADVADGKALVAQEQAQDAADRITHQQSVFRVTPTGAEVASIDNSSLVRITPDGVSIIQGGAIASTWDAARLIVNEAIVSRATMSNHVVEKSSTRTIWRPLA